MPVLPNKQRPMQARMLEDKIESANDTPAVHCSAVWLHPRQPRKIW
jgi:hypothetical protein